MSVESYNTIELRYADSELAKHRFVRDSDYKTLEEENEILRAERAHWHNMYNAESAPEIDTNACDDLANRGGF